MKKITFVGDIMCEPLLLRAAQKNGGYDFHGVFDNVKDIFSESDFVVGNLETPIAGQACGYTSGLFSFNTPIEFLDAVKDAGIDLVLTANNHCFDRGVDGMVNTIQALDAKGIAHTGTFRNQNSREEAAYFDLDGTRVAVISYTYGTNYSANHILLSDEQQYLVNLLRPQTELYFIPKKRKITFSLRVINRLLRFFSEEKRYHIKHLLRMEVNQAHPDDSLNVQTAEPFLKKMREDISVAKQKSDLVIFCPHIGGQFNASPGVFSEYVFEQAVKAGCDAIVASHAHVVLKSDIIKGVPSFYSLGNFSMSPNSIYLVWDQKPEYGIAVHMYVEGKSIRKVSFSILKILESKKKMLAVIPVDQLEKELSDKVQIEQLKDDVGFIYQTVTGKTLLPTSIEKEYFLNS